MSVLAWQAVSVVVLAAMAGFVWLAHANRASRISEEAVRRTREQRARALGWRYDGTHDGDIRYRMFGTSPGGLAWELKFDSDHSSSSSQPKLVWTAASLKGDGTVFHLGSRKVFEVLTGATLKKLASFASSLFGQFSASVEDYNEFVQAARPAQGGSTRFRSRFVVAARPGELPADLIDGELERLILAWPAPMPRRFAPEQDVCAWLDRRGLRVECRIDGPSMRVCEQVVRLGERLGDRLAGGRSRRGFSG